MELYELKQNLVNKKTAGLYVFTGTETAIMDIYINKVAETAQCDIVRVDNVKDVYSRLRNTRIIDKPSCYVIRDDKDYLDKESVWEGLKSGIAQGKNIIILVYTKLHKTGRFYKHHSDILVTFDKLPSTVLAKYVMKEISLTKVSAEWLASICECDYNRILLECDKIKHLAQANNVTAEEALDLAVKHNLIYVAPTDVVFDFIAAVCKRQHQVSYELLQQLKELGESPLAMISLLYTNFRSLLLVTGSGDSKDLVARTGLTPWQIKLAKGYGKHYSLEELVRAIRVIRETEKGIKTGHIEAEMAVDYILVNIL